MASSAGSTVVDTHTSLTVVARAVRVHHPAQHGLSRKVQKCLAGESRASHTGLDDGDHFHRR